MSASVRLRYRGCLSAILPGGCVLSTRRQSAGRLGQHTFQFVLICHAKPLMYAKPVMLCCGVLQAPR